MNNVYVVDSEEIIYVGNDYRTDIYGASSRCIDAIWLDIKHLENKGEVE